MQWKSEEQLLAYAQKLENNSVRNANLELLKSKSCVLSFTPDYSKNYRGKGGYGEFIEENYFGKKNDSESKADFDEIGVELKVVPLRVLDDGSVRVKERIVLNSFRFNDIVNEKFETSHFLEKDKLLLFIFYFHSNLEFADKMIDLVDLWKVIEHDITQIREDWQYIVDKIRDGKAHELSEGDTLYLGACTKGATADSSWQKQPFSNEKAKSRALCFKVSYANMIYKRLKEIQTQAERKEPYLLDIGESIPMEAKLEDMIRPFIGKTGQQIYEYFHKTYSPLNKARYGFASRYILGLYSTKDSYYEFEAANIQIKSIRVELNGTINESMSFKNIQYMDIPNQNWEDSDFYNELTSKFIFMVYRKCKNQDDYYLADFIFWNMPEKDLEEVRGIWERTKQLIIAGDYNHFPKISDSAIAHVRPKGKDSWDLMPTIQGRNEKKKCFFLNRDYIKKIVDEHSN